MTATVRAERDGTVARLIIDRPPVNVLDIDTMRSASECLDCISRDRAVKLLTISGAGKAFSAGVDVADHTDERVELMLRTFHRLIHGVMTMRVPVIALVHGAALGGGCELALACDIILARSDARFGLPEIKLGVFPPVAAALLPRLVGRQRSLDLILRGNTFTGDEAKQLGLAAHAWPADDYPGRVAEYLRELSQLSGPALRLAKRATDTGLDLCFHDALAAAEEIYRRDSMALADAHEGVAAFMEKRTPVWKEA